MRKTPNRVDVFVGQRLRIRRLAVQMSQEKLADQVGLTFQQVQKYEKGSNRISASRLHQFATILGVPVAFFFDGLDQHGALAADPGTAFLATREGAAIAQAWGGLSDAGRAAVLAVVQSLPPIRHDEAARSAWPRSPPSSPRRSVSRGCSATSPARGLCLIRRPAAHRTSISGRITTTTSGPRTNYANAAQQKRAWVYEHLGPHVTVLPVMGGHNKPLFMHAPGDILIDDLEKNTRAWDAAGGMSILHRDFDGTRLQLQTHLAIVESKTRKALDAARRAHEAGWDAA